MHSPDWIKRRCLVALNPCAYQHNYAWHLWPILRIVQLCMFVCSCMYKITLIATMNCHFSLHEYRRTEIYTTENLQQYHGVRLWIARTNYWSNRTRTSIPAIGFRENWMINRGGSRPCMHAWPTIQSWVTEKKSYRQINWLHELEYKQSTI